MKLLAALAATAAVVAAILVLSAGGSAGSESDEPPVGVGQVRAGSVASLAQCSDWVEGTEDQRQVTIGDIHDQLNQAGADGPTPDLPAEDAYALFERACANDYAAGFRLYKLYARAGAFSTLLDG